MLYPYNWSSFDKYSNMQDTGRQYQFDWYSERKKKNAKLNHK